MHPPIRQVSTSKRAAPTNSPNRARSELATTRRRTHTHPSARRARPAVRGVVPSVHFFPRWRYHSASVLAPTDPPPPLALPPLFPFSDPRVPNDGTPATPQGRRRWRPRGGTARCCRRASQGAGRGGGWRAGGGGQGRPAGRRVRHDDCRRQQRWRVWRRVAVTSWGCNRGGGSRCYRSGGRGSGRR